MGVQKPEPELKSLAESRYVPLGSRRIDVLPHHSLRALLRVEKARYAAVKTRHLHVRKSNY